MIAAMRVDLVNIADDGWAGSAIRSVLECYDITVALHPMATTGACGQRATTVGPRTHRDTQAGRSVAGSGPRRLEWMCRKEGTTMATSAKARQGNSGHKEHPFDHLRATPEQRARLLAAAHPFDVAAWQRGSVSPTPEELADLDNFLQELEEMRRQGIQRQDERLAESEE